jgi:2-iminobutanoate/2-iminopropanoate deaminase
MDKTVVSTRHAPEAVGAYSQAVSSGGLVFCSGQIAIDPATGDLIQDSIASETRRCMDNLAAVLEAAGTSFANVVKVTAYLTGMGHFAEFNEAYGGYFGQDPPARATIGVEALPKGARVEIECVARG